MQMSQALAQQFLGDRGGGEEPGDGAGSRLQPGEELGLHLDSDGSSSRSLGSSCNCCGFQDERHFPWREDKWGWRWWKE